MTADLQERDIDPLQQVRNLAGVMKRSWFIIFTMTTLGLLIGISLFLFLPKQYTSTAKILMRGTWMFDRPADVEEIKDMPMQTKSKLLEEELRSGNWVKEVLSQLEWAEWARARDEGTAPEFIGAIQDRINVVVRTGLTGERLVFLGFTYSEAAKARDFCRELRDHWLFEFRDSYLEMVNQRVADLKRSVTEKDNNLREARQALQGFEAKNGVTAAFLGINRSTRKQAIAQRLDTLAGEIVGLQEQQDSWARYLSEEGANGEPLIPQYLSQTEEIENTTHRQILLSIEQLTRQLQVLKAQDYTDLHPKMSQLKDRITDQLELLKSSDLPPAMAVKINPIPNPKYEDIKSRMREAAVAAASAQAEQTRLQRELAEIEKEMSVLPILIQEIEARKQDIAVLQQMYDRARMELQTPLDLQKGLRAPGSDRLKGYTFLEEPRAATEATATTGLIALGAAVFIGLGLSLIIVLGREFLKTSYSSADQAQRSLSLPVLGEVAPIQTELEARRARMQRTLQVAASFTLLLGLGASIYVCMMHAELLPVGLLEWAAGVREGLG